MTTPTSALPQDFADFLDALAAEGVEYLVVGAHALAVHGLVRATGDLDVLVRPTTDNARRAWRALARFGAPLAATGVTPETVAAPGQVIQLGVPPFRIDVLTQLTGVTFEEAWGGRVVIQLGALAVPFIGRAELVRNKRATGRTKDVADAEALEQV